jgi:hypothetical protein
LQVAAQLALAKGLSLTLVGKRDRALGELSKHGINAVTGEVADGAIVVGAVDEPGTHIVAQARPDDEAVTIDDWAGSLSASVPAGGMA